MTCLNVPKLTAVDAFTPEGYGPFAGYEAPTAVIIVYQENLLRELAGRLEMIVDRCWPLAKHPYRQLLRGIRLCDVGCLLLEVGGAPTAYVVQTLAHFGTRRVILLTSAAALTGEVASGLFAVHSAQRFTPPGVPVELLPRKLPGEWLPPPGGCVPVHALTSEHFFRPNCAEVNVVSSLPCVLEMEAFHAFSAAASSLCELEILGYVSDRFTPAGWTRGANHSALQGRLVQIVEATLNSARGEI